MAHIRPRRAGGLLVAAAALTVGLVIAPGASLTAHAADAPVGLGAAETFAVLGGQEVTNTGTTLVSGDVGVNPGSSVTGFGPGIVTNGSIHTTDALSLQAQADLVTAYNDASSRTPVLLTSPDLTGLSLPAGTYSGGALEVNGDLTLVGDKDAVFIFQADSSLVTASNSKILLSGEVSACNVFWRVPSSATLGTASVFVGTVMAMTSITANNTATIAGRLLARTGTVTLDANVITGPTGCAADDGDGGSDGDGGGTGDGDGTGGGTGDGTGDGSGTAGGGTGAAAAAVEAAKPALAETGADLTGALLAAGVFIGFGLLFTARARSRTLSRR